jgi:hypothetical protein
VEVEALQQPAADALAGAAGLEQHVVRQHHAGAAVGVEHGHDVLQKVELLVGRGELEVLALVVLALGGHRAVLAHHRVARFLAERRIGQHHVEAPAIIAGQGVALHHRAAAIA